MSGTKRRIGSQEEEEKNGAAGATDTTKVDKDHKVDEAGLLSGETGDKEQDTD